MEKTLLDNALRYAALGWKLFPAFWKKSHIGLVKWSVESTNDLDTIRGWADKWPNCYFCVAAHQSNLAVIDVDNKNGKNGTASFFDIQIKNSKLPKTMITKTPSNGYHYVFKGGISVTFDRLGEGIDTPAMVPLPGTNIKGKGSYILLSDKNVLPATLPEWAIGALKSKPPVNERSLTLSSKVDLDTPKSISEATKFLTKRAPIATEGDHGDATTYQVTCIVRDYGVSPEKALELMLDHWNERCEPPWAVEALKTKIDNAYSYAQNPIGVMSPQAEFDVIQGDEELTGPTPISAFQGHPPPREWILSDWLPAREIAALYGDGGLGKGLLALQLGLNVSSGEGRFLGIEIKKQVPVLYVACEDKEEEIHRRIYDIKSASGYEFISNDAPFYVWSRVGEESILAYQEGTLLQEGNFYKPLCEQIEKLAKGGLLILDTLSDVFAVNENDRQIAGACIKTVLGGIVKKYGCTLLVLAHPSKTSQASGVGDSGSTGWRNSLRTAWYMSAHEDKDLLDYRYLKRTKSNYSGKSEPRVLKWERGSFRDVSEEEVVNDEYGYCVELIYNLIKTQCEKDQRVGLHHMSSPSLYNIDLCDRNGKSISRETRNKIKDQLIISGRVKEVKNAPGQNGLWSAALFDKTFEKK